MNATLISKPKKTRNWQKTTFANLIRYTPSGVYFLRVRVQGKLVRRSLKTDVLTVAKLRLVDEEKKLRQASKAGQAVQRGRGQMSFLDSLEIYRLRLGQSHDIKLRTKSYYEQRVTALLRSWPGLEKINVREITRDDCLNWAGKFEASPTAYNNTVSVLKSILDLAIERGVIYNNPAHRLARRSVKPKELHLPDSKMFHEFVKSIDDAGGRFSRDCANLVRFLSYGGFRLGEARHVTWGDCDFTRQEIVVRGAPEEGTKNGEIRRVPMIEEMRELLERLRRERSEEPMRIPAHLGQRIRF